MIDVQFDGARYLVDGDDVASPFGCKLLLRHVTRTKKQNKRAVLGVFPSFENSPKYPLREGRGAPPATPSRTP